MAEQTGRRSVLGRQWKINGELIIDDDATIEGQVNGTVRVRGELELAEGSHVTGTIIGASIRVAGEAEADIVGEEDVELLPGSKMRGRVYASRFCVNEGAGFRGEICVDADAMQEAEQEVLSKLPAPAPDDGDGEAEGPELTAEELAVLRSRGQGEGDGGSGSAARRSMRLSPAGRGNGR